MPAATMQRSPHLAELEKGLKCLKSSKLRSRQEFETMYGVIEEHHRNLRLGYLTGMSPDRRKQAEEDCKFYYILAKMMGEIDSGGEASQQSGLVKVYEWFEQNRAARSTAPRFGHAKRKSARSARPSTGGTSVSMVSSSRKPPSRTCRPGSSTSQVSSAKSRRTTDPQSSQEQVSGGDVGACNAPTPKPTSSPGSEVSAATERYFRQYGDGHIEDMDPTERRLPVDAMSSELPLTQRPHSAPTQHETRPQAPTPDVAIAGRSRRPHTAASKSVLLPRRKPLPLPHVFNPLSKALEATVPLCTPGPPTDRSTSSNTSRFQLQSRGGSVYQDAAGGVISLGMTHLQKWDTFQHNQRLSQDMLGVDSVNNLLSAFDLGQVIGTVDTTLGIYTAIDNLEANPAKLQHVGRAGVPGSTRYAAHEHGVTTEGMTQQVIASYAALDEYRKAQNGQTPPGDQRNLIESPLEEFYKSTEPYYPVRRNKYPSFRGKSTPPISKGSGRAGKENTATDGLVGGGEAGPDRAPLRLDVLVSMIDTVTDEMNIHKEKVAPDPLPGFRQPLVYVEVGSRPQTAPPQAGARPTSPQEGRDARSESHMYTQVAPEREQLLLRPTTEGAGGRPSGHPSLELIDWRGKVTPDSARSKWSQSFGNHSFVRKQARPRSSLRSARPEGGSSTRRPNTSCTVATVDERWDLDTYASDRKRPAVAASHTTLEVDADVVSSLLTSTKCDSSSVRTRPQLEEEDDEDVFAYLREFSHHSEGGHQSATPPTKAYLSFCMSMRSQELRLSRQDDQTSLSLQLGNTTSCTPTAIQEVPDIPPAPILTDTRRFLEEVQHLIANGALDEEEDCDNDQRNLNTARSTNGEAEAAVVAHVVEDEWIGKQRHLTVMTEDGERVLPGEDDTAPQVPVPAGDGTRTAADFGLSEDEAAIMGLDVDAYLRRYAPGASSVVALGGGGASGRLSASYRHRVFQHAFPGSSTPCPTSGLADHNVDAGDATCETLTVEGRGACTDDKRKSRLASGAIADAAVAKVGKGRRARVVGTANPLRVLQKQSEMLKKSPCEPYRTPPSIPTPWGQFGTRTQKPAPLSSVYMAELEAQSRHMKSPRSYVQKVSELRRSDTLVEHLVPHLPPSEEMTPEQCQLVEQLKVFRMKHEDGTPITISSGNRWADRSQTATRTHTEHYLGHNSHQCHDNEQHHHDHGHEFTQHPHGSDHHGARTCAVCVQETGQNVAYQGPDMGQRLLDMGRPIPQYLPAADPVQVAAAAQRLREAEAAVDIQRIFRGFVARNHYKYLMAEQRQEKEDRQKAAIEIQRHMRGHLSRKRAIYERKADPESREWARDYDHHLKGRERVRKVKSLEDQERIGKKNVETAARLAIIGPHVDVYEPFHPKRTGPNRALLYRAATVIQKWTRGWLIRLRLDRLKRKAKYHSSSWIKFMMQYRELLRWIQLRAGIDKPRTPFSFRDISEYMDLKKRYESVFEKRAFGGKIERAELTAYFKECDLYPAKSEVEQACDQIFRGQGLNKSRGLYKGEVMEVTFQIYPPNGTGIQNTRSSTWLSPIIDGEEAVKLSGTENVEETDFKTCWKLVSGTAKERREEEAAAFRDAEEQQEVLEDEQRQAAARARRRADRKAATPTPPEVPAPEVAPPEPTVSAPEAEKTVDSPDDLSVTVEVSETMESTPTEKKSFLEENLERIENEAPVWELPTIDARALVCAELPVADVLRDEKVDTKTEATETEPKINKQEYT